MSFDLMREAFSQKLPAMEKYLLLAYCDYADEKGECFPSVFSISEKTGISEVTVRKLNASLAKKGIIKRFKGKYKSHTTKIFLENSHKAKETEISNQEELSSPQIDAEKLTQKEVSEKERQENKELTKTLGTALAVVSDPKKSVKKKGTRLPDDWELPEAGRDFAENLGIDADLELEKFKDHWAQDGTQKAVKLDWLAAWRNWCRNSLKFGNYPSNNSSAKSKHPMSWMVEDAREGKLFNEPNRSY